jgi:hypothetical protein
MLVRRSGETAKRAIRTEFPLPSLTERPMVPVYGWLSAVALVLASLCYEFEGLLNLLHR